MLNSKRRRKKSILYEMMLTDEDRLEASLFRQRDFVDSFAKNQVSAIAGASFKTVN